MENVLERMIALTRNRRGITLADVPDQIQNKSQWNTPSFIEIPEDGINFQNVVTDIERELIMQSLRRTNGNKMLSAKLLSLKRTTLIEKIKRIGLNENISPAEHFEEALQT